LVFFVLFCIFLDCVATAFSLTKQLAMAEEEEPVDMKEVYEEACKPKCGKELREYEACQKRIEDDTTGEAHCTGQYLDFWKCIDKCAAPKIFANTR